MNLSQKFIYRLIGYFFLFYFLFILVVLGTIGAAFSVYQDKLLETYVMDESTTTMRSYIDTTTDKVKVKKVLLDKVKDSGTLYVKKNNKIIYQSGKEKLLPLAEYDEWMFSTWQTEKDIEVIFVENNQMLKSKMKFEVDAKDRYDFLKKKHMSLFKYVQGKGVERVVGNLPVKDVNREIFRNYNTDDYSKYAFTTFTKKKEKYFIVKKNEDVQDERSIYSDDLKYNKELVDALKIFAKWFSVFNIIIILIIIFIAWLIGGRLTRPLLHYISWVEQLGLGHYQLPNNTKLYKNGFLKRKYRMYDAVDKAISKLTHKLSHDKDYRQKVNKLREDWVRGITHDIKTPLSSIYGYSKILNSGMEMTDEERLKFTKIIEDKSEYIDQLLKDLNMTYQLKNDGIDIHPEPVLLNEYIKHFVSKFNNDYLAYVNDTKISVMIDSERMDRVMNNIITNSFLHNKDVNVWINTFVEGHEAIIKISDNGSGIDPNDLPYIFDQFYRGQKTTEHHSGSGIGLSVSKQIVEAHNGTITVHSSGEGTQFEIRLPVQ